MHRGLFWFCGQVSAAGAANYETDGDEDVADGKLRVFEAGEHGGHGDRSDAGAVLVNGGERDWQKARVADIVHANDADLFRDPDPESEECLHEAGGREVVGTDDATRAAGID